MASKEMQEQKENDEIVDRIASFIDAKGFAPLTKAEQEMKAAIDTLQKQTEHEGIPFMEYLFELSIANIILDKCFGKDRTRTLDSDYVIKAFNSITEKERLVLETHYITGISIDDMPLLFNMTKTEIEQFEQDVFNDLKDQLSYDFAENSEDPITDIPVDVTPSLFIRMYHELLLI